LLLDQLSIINLPVCLESAIMRISALALVIALTAGSGAAGELHNKFKAKGKLFFGAEIDHYHLNNGPLTTIAKNSFGQVTAENSMKWDATEREYPCYPLPPRTHVRKN
jgi:hypothetical protein